MSGCDKLVPMSAPKAKPYFEAWVGKHAHGEGGVRWHVLGESHYLHSGPDAYELSPLLTQQVVRDWALHDKGSAFFTRVACIIANQPAEAIDRAQIWQQIAYSNFVQRPLDGPRQAPLPEDFEAARTCFWGQIALTRPEVLVVLGSRLWEQLPTDFCVKLPPFKFEAGDDWPVIDDAWLYPLLHGREWTFTVAVKVVHPSAGFGRWNWQIAARRAHTAMLCHSNIIEWVVSEFDLN